MPRRPTMTSRVEMFVTGQFARFCSESRRRKTMDRRVQRTHDVLHRALMSLIIEKGYEVITVQDIIDRANVGRSTFYTHYVGKQDLLRKGLTHLKEQLLTHQRAARASKRTPTEQVFAFSLALF